MKPGLAVASLVLAAVTAGACFGRSDLKLGPDRSGGGGAAGQAGAGGGTSASTSSGWSSTSSGWSSTSSSWSSTSSSWSSTSSSGSCDYSGDCYVCQDCAMQGNCAGPTAACQQSQECNGFIACLEECGNKCGNDDWCFNECAQGPDGTGGCVGQYPEGMELYMELVYCVICDECYEDCDGDEWC